MVGVSSPEIDHENGGAVPLELAFGLGWAAADHAHLPALPEALMQVLSVAAVRVAITHWDGSLLMDNTFPPPEERAKQSLLFVYEAEERLGTEYDLRVTLETEMELSTKQSQTFDSAIRLIREALECILVGQRDREALGEPFTRLSAREWQICLLLERPDGEKQIAASLNCSRHTVHDHVKKIYRELQVRSRLQVLDHLKRAREQLRRRTLGGFAGRAARRGKTNRAKT